MNQKNIVLFPAFVESVENKIEISKRDLVFLVSKFLDDLIDKDILKISRDCVLDTPYAFYKILLHENLIEHNGFIDKKMEMLS